MNRHWQVRLKDIAQIERRGVNPSEILEGTTYVGLEHISSGGDGLASTKVGAGELGSNKFKFTSDHILYGKLRPYLAKIVAPDFDGICSTDILPIRPTSQVDKRYLLHYLRLPQNVAWATGRATGVNLPRLSPSELGELSVPLPPLEEQRRIAAILDKADALRQKRKRAIALLDSLTQSIFLDMFGDGTRGSNSFPIRRLEELCANNSDIRCGPFGTQLNKDEFTEDGVPLWGIKQVNSHFKLPTREYITEKKSRELSNYDLRPNDLVMTRKGTVGNCAVYPKEFPVGIMHSDLLRIRLDSEICEPVFLTYQLHLSRQVERQISLISGGAIMAGINVGKLKQLEVFLPDIRFQREFADRIGLAKKIERSALSGLDHVNENFVSLQHRAFSGQL